MTSSVPLLDLDEVARAPHRFFRRRYVWQWPIRLYHWVNALSVTALFGTGLYMAFPVLVSPGEAFDAFAMGRVQQVHFAFAFIFVINHLWRIYWFWMGNNYARSGFPFVWRAAWWKDLLRQAGDYLRIEPGHIHLGHNALGGLTYTLFVVLLGWAQIFTGLALYSESNPGGFWDGLVGWVIPLLGSSFQTHMWHHLFAWCFVVFAILHVYVVFHDGQQYKNGLVSSMVSGVKFFRDGHVDHETWLS